jgi:hypothetical protein
MLFGGKSPGVPWIIAEHAEHDAKANKLLSNNKGNQ